VVGAAGIDSLLSLLVAMLALITTVFAIQPTVSLRSDEASGIVEPQSAGSMSRGCWVPQRLLIPAVGSAVLLLLGGGILGATYGSTIGGMGQTGGSLGRRWPTGRP